MPDVFEVCSACQKLRSFRIIYEYFIVICLSFFIYTHIYTIPTGTIVIYEYINSDWILQFS